MTPLPLAGLLGACLPSPGTVQPIIDLEARRIAEDASLDVRLAAGAGALAATFCDLDLADWEAEVGEDGADQWCAGADIAPIADNLGMVEPAELVLQPDTGLVEVTWAAEPVPGTALDLALRVLVAGSEYELDIRPQDPDALHPVGMASMEVTCDDLPSVTVALELTVDDEVVHVTNMPPAGGDPPVWDRFDLWPTRGGFHWSDGGAGQDERRAESEDVGELLFSGGTSATGATSAGCTAPGPEGTPEAWWPAWASQADWEAPIQVPVHRPPSQ